MDFAALAREVTGLLVPLLPYLEQAGGKMAGEIAHKVGESVWEGAKALWGRLKPQVAAKESGRAAVEEVIRRPTDPRAQGALELQVEELLVANPSFAEEIARLLEAAGPHASWAHLEGDGAIAQGTRAVAAANSSIAAGGDVVFGGPSPGDLEKRRGDS